MENFTYYNPTRIEFGRGAEHNIGKHIKKDGIKKVLLCYGSERIKSDGLFDAVKKSLDENSISFVEAGGVVSNPLISKVRSSITIARENKVEAILSVGGGSVLDSSKAVAAGFYYDGDVWDLFTRKGEITNALSIYDIITLAATGSEMNSGAVVTNDETKEKFFIDAVSIFPKVSAVNPVLMQSVPTNYLVYSATDIIAHSIEGYFTASIQPNLQSRIVEAIINTVKETTAILLSNPDDYDARAEFAWASTLALNGVTTSGTGGAQSPNHMIEHSLSAIFNVPHGAGLSVVIPAWMKWYNKQNTKQFERFADKIFGLSTADEGIAELEKWFNKIGTPTRLSQLNITKDDIPTIVDNVLKNAKLFGMDDVYTKDVIKTILELAL